MWTELSLKKKKTVHMFREGIEIEYQWGKMKR